MAGGRGWLRRAVPFLGLCCALGLAGCHRGKPSPSSVSEQSGRSVLLPQRLGWLSSERASGALPSAVALGGKASGRVLLYFEFAASPPGRRLLRAELVLTVSGAPGTSIGVELSRAEAVRGELLRWSDQPRARYPRLSAQLSSDGEPARLDVTELMRAESKPGEPLRLLLRAEPDAPEPLLIETGAAGGAAPRLQAYWE
ncbi:MAG: hypothetical protein ABUL60_35145 [Myxococcales bacterium]